jgi:hypothetical protein
MCRRPGLSAALATLLAGSIAAGLGGCAALPALSILPSLISLVHDLSGKKSNGESGADTANQDAELEAAEPSAPPPKLTPENVCQLIAIARPDLVVVELRKSAAAAPEYRELRLINSTDSARWTPLVDSDTGPDGWRPAVNFLKMNFKPPLADAIPDNGTSYLAYAPVAADSNNPNQPAELNSASAGVGAFSWSGQAYQYAVARTLPCLAPSASNASAE